MVIDSLIAKNLRIYRKLNNLTQQELAYKSGVSKCMIGYIEQDVTNPSARIIDKLSIALNIHPSFLFMENNNLRLHKIKKQNKANFLSGVFLYKNESMTIMPLSKEGKKK